MDPLDSRSPSPWSLGYIPGERVRVVGGIFAGCAGTVLTHEEAEQHLGVADQFRCRPTPDSVWVLLDILGRPTAVNLEPEHLEHT
jgi:transcription antitermination factor NusG